MKFPSIPPHLALPSRSICWKISTRRERFRNYPSILRLNFFFLQKKGIFRRRGGEENGAKLLSDEMVNASLPFFSFFFQLSRKNWKSFFFFGRRLYILMGNIYFKDIYNLDKLLGDIVAGWRNIILVAFVNSLSFL